MSEPLDTIREWIETALPTLTEVISEYQPIADAPRPVGLHATVRLTADRRGSGTPYRYTSQVPDGTDFVAKIFGRRRGTIRVTIYGSGAAALLRDLESSQYVKASWDILRDGGIAVHRISDVIDTTGLLSTTNKESAFVDFACGFIHEVTHATPAIESAEIDATFTPQGAP
jgi:hypothetical protein